MPEGDMGEAPDHAFAVSAAVEAVLVGGEVAGAECAAGAGDGRPDVAEDHVDAGEGGFGNYRGYHIQSTFRNYRGLYTQSIFRLARRATGGREATPSLVSVAAIQVEQQAPKVRPVRMLAFMTGRQPKDRGRSTGRGATHPHSAASTGLGNSLTPYSSGPCSRFSAPAANGGVISDILHSSHYSHHAVRCR